MAFSERSLPTHATPPSMSFFTACYSFAPSIDNPTLHNDPRSPFWGRMFSTVLRPFFGSPLSFCTLHSVLSTLTWEVLP